ncbi:MAG TPA: hypothetical protein PLN41_09455 [Methanothrix sp.]|nr:hypothetical protein [Methanothrix sp.]
MGREERQKLISEIETLRCSKVITYMITTKPGVPSQIDTVDLREMYDHLLKIGKAEKIDLVIYSLGGTATVAWALSNLIREFTEKFTVLVPSFAFSCATAIALGANNIIMGKMGTLGPVDPSVSNAFNPIIKNQKEPISVEDIGGYISLLRDKIDLRDEKNFTEVFSRLCVEVHPLALGNAYRHYIKARDDTRKLLELHMDPKEQGTQINNIIDTLVEKLYFHGHHIPRTEADKIGLKVQNAEDIRCNGRNLDEIMWDLFLDYEKELDLKTPYEDDVSTGDKRVIPMKFIESIGSTSALVVGQRFDKLSLPGGSFFTQISTPTGQMLSLAVMKEGGQIQIVPYIGKGGRAVYINGDLYEKHETVSWRNFSTDDELYKTDA